MDLRFSRIAAVFFIILAIVPLHAAVSRQQADAFARKVANIQQQAKADAPRTAGRRTPVSQDEVNSWFQYRAQPVLPVGVASPKLTIIGQGRVMGEATVDLEAIAKRRGAANSGGFNPWTYLGGTVPITVTGILHTDNGRGRFELESAEVSGVPVPKTVMQQLLTYYSRSANNPAGFGLDDPFPLPAGISKIEVGQGQAVVVQQ